MWNEQQHQEEGDVDDVNMMIKKKLHFLSLHSKSTQQNTATSQKTKTLASPTSP